MGLNSSKDNVILDMLDSCGVKRELVCAKDGAFSFRSNGVIVSFKANIEDDGYGLFSGEIYRDSLSSEEVKAMHVELDRIKDSVSGIVVDNERWVKFIRQYNYRHVFEFGTPVQIVPVIVGIANMPLDEYIMTMLGQDAVGGKSFLDSKDSMIGGSLRKSLGVYN